MTTNDSTLNPEDVDALQTRLMAHIHFYQGMLDSINDGTYTVVSARKDFLALHYNEEYGDIAEYVYELAHSADWDEDEQ